MRDLAWFSPCLSTHPLHALMRDLAWFSPCLSTHLCFAYGEKRTEHERSGPWMCFWTRRGFRVSLRSSFPDARLNTIQPLLKHPPLPCALMRDLAWFSPGLSTRLCFAYGEGRTEHKRSSLWICLWTRQGFLMSLRSSFPDARINAI